MKRVVLVGLGMVARTHVAAIRDCGAVELYGVMARDSEKARAFAEEVAAPVVFESARQIAGNAEVDLVIVATPPNARVDLVDALAGGGKPILMEKPIERDLKAATAIVDTCEQNGVPLGIVFQHRARDVSRMLADRLEGGDLGAVRVVEIAVPWWREQAYYDEPGRGTFARDGGGVLISQAIHTMDLALSLAGPVARVQAMAATSAFHDMEAEDFVAAGLQFENGAVGSLMASTASFPGDAESIVLHCDNGSARLQSGVLTIDWREGSREETGEAGGTGGGADPMAFTHGWHQAVIEDFAGALDTGRPPLCSGREALKVHRLIDALVRSASEGRAVSVST